MSMKVSKSHKLKGVKNSSITRVRPVFQKLLHLDLTGKIWIPKLLQLCNLNQENSKSILLNFTNLKTEITRKRPYIDRVLKSYGIKSIELENCFEKSLPPPSRFLEWLIKNIDKFISNKIKSKNANTIKNRSDLFGSNGIDAQKSAQHLALSQLQLKTAKKSKNEWWAFEGFTEVDCYLETENLILLIEGKRTEPLSSSTMWYPERNLVIRNLEVAQEAAQEAGKAFGVILISEELIQFDLEKEAQKGLPHFSKDEIDDIIRHYLGNITWKDVCDVNGISFSDIPNTTQDVVSKILNTPL